MIKITDLAKLLQSIREQDVMKTDIPAIEADYVTYVMTEFMRRMLCMLG